MDDLHVLLMKLVRLIGVHIVIVWPGVVSSKLVVRQGYNNVTFVHYSTIERSHILGAL